jgi:hypothetical protein
MTNHVVQPQVDCPTAQEFLDALSPLGPNFKNDSPNAPWLFRGQGGDWPLIPSLFRKDPVAIDILKSFTSRNIGDISELLLVERDLIVQFFEIADKRGLVIPDDSQDLRIFLETVKRLDDHVRNGDWKGRIKDKALSLMALAQHYGIPTRLLDWTRQAYIAAFFAGESAKKLLENKKIDPTERLVVWAFYFPDLGKQDEDAKKYDPVIIVTAPKATNTNLKAQQGVFSLLNSIYPRDFSAEKYTGYLLNDLVGTTPEIQYFNDSEGVYPPLDSLLENLAQMANTWALLPPERERWNKLVCDIKFQKFTLPVSEAPLLLYSLSKYDIMPSTIYPGYHSVVSDLKVYKQWK